MARLIVLGIAGFAMWCVASATPEGQLITGLNVGPQFDVVSIKPSPGNFAAATPIERPDGGLTMTRVSAMALIARAYPSAIPNQMRGLPEWAKAEYYDIAATASLSHATPEDRAALLRAMLADRFKLITHFADRERSILVVDHIEPPRPNN